MQEYALGIDGGGSKTHVAIVDRDGRLLGQGQAGPSNYHDVGTDEARRNIGQAVESACAKANLEGSSFAAVFLGMASVVSEADRAVIRSIARDLDLAPAERVGVDHDCRIALAGGLSGRPGIVQIAGTGSSTFGMNASGEAWRSGGWGHLLADEGSGCWLGLQAMTAAVRSHDGRIAPTILEQRIRETLHLVDMNEIMHRLYVQEMSRTEIAALAPLVTEAASEGDVCARRLVEKGCQEMADCVRAVARKLELDSDSSELALVGGLFGAGEVVRKPFAEAVHALLPNCTITVAEHSPVQGACILALELLDKRLKPQQLP